jgi:glutamate-1-semialdehyde 2,1-aminomutase
VATAVSSTLQERYEAEFPRSRELHGRAKMLFPNGVTHDLRHLEPFPIYIDRAKGAHKWDVDGHELIDYWAGHGAILLGHSHPAIVAALQTQMAKATHPGACHELEIAWGEWVKQLVPSAEKLRFTSSGTEATLMALRLARIHTGRPRLLKFAGHFHGWHDFVIAGADPPYPGSSVPGIPNELASQTVVISPNDPELVEQKLTTDKTIGAVILEPTGGHWGAVPIRGPFLKALREITTRHGVLLIFDEVITGFRVSPGGAQSYYKVPPDLTTLAKILAGGLPGGCVAGRADILAHLEFHPDRAKMKHPGTFNANPLSAAAGIETLKLVSTGKPGNQAIATARRLRSRLNEEFVRRQDDWLAYGEFSGFRLLPNYQGPRPGNDDFIPYEGSLEKLDSPRDPRLSHAFRQGMLLNGVDLPGLGGMTTAAHSDADIEKTVAAVVNTLDLLGAERLI